MSVGQSSLIQQHQQSFHPPSAQHGQPQAAGQQPWGGPFPSLHLWPIQDTFQMKMIHLPPGQKVKIGRQTNTKTIPGERNAFFDSKVLSRTHAEIWEQGNKIYIKDVKSSNGTFINGGRLSPEGVESEPYVLKSEDMVEFGIDIISEDNRTIIHHKVSAKAYCVFGPEDAALSARELAHYQNDPRGVRRQGPGSMPQAAGVNPLSHMGPPIMSAGGKPNGLSFEHVLQKLQTELNRSKETGQELQGLTTAMSDVQDTLGGGLAPGQNGSAGQYIPAQFRNPSAEAQAALAGPHGPQAAAYIALQAQMGDTQSSLAGHLDRIRQLEVQIQAQDALKQEIANVRQQMEESKYEMTKLLAASASHDMDHDDDDEAAEDDDDTRSVATVVPDSSSARSRSKSGRGSDKVNGTNGSATQLEAIDPNAELAARIQSLTSEMADALQLSRTLQAQHSEAMAAVKVLTERVGVLESGIAERVSTAVIQAEGRWDAWRIKFEDRWMKERDGWEAEQERLRGVVREWEEASRRAAEEEEERELNETLSEDELADEEGEDAGGEDVEAGELIAVHNHWPNGPDQPLDIADVTTYRVGKPRRRRPSTKASLAMRGLRSVVTPAGASTPKAADPETPSAALPPPRELRRDALSRVKRLSGREKRVRSSSPNAFGEKESSESGRESADTLRGEKDQVGERKADGASLPPMSPSIPIATVIIVAALAGVLYYRHKE